MEKCKYCSKDCNGLKGLSSHERRCSFNLNNKEVNGDGSSLDSLLALSRSNCIEETKKVYRTMIEEHNWSYSDCLLGKKKYITVQANCKRFQNRSDFELSLLEYLLKMVDSNIKPNNIGKDLSSYQLCRYGDLGAYTVDNCFFDTFENNLKTQADHTDYSNRDRSWVKTPENRLRSSISAKKQWAEGRGHSKKVMIN